MLGISMIIQEQISWIASYYCNLLHTKSSIFLYKLFLIMYTCLMNFLLTCMSRSQYGCQFALKKKNLILFQVDSKRFELREFPSLSPGMLGLWYFHKHVILCIYTNMWFCVHVVKQWLYMPLLIKKLSFLMFCFCHFAKSTNISCTYT
jgi:hypothetical protein